MPNVYLFHYTYSESKKCANILCMCSFLTFKAIKTNSRLATRYLNSQCPIRVSPYQLLVLLNFFLETSRLNSQQYLMSASLLVTATPTVDSAADVTWPAWEKLSLVLTYLAMQGNRLEKWSVKEKRKQHVKQTGTVDCKSLHVTDISLCQFNHCRVPLLLFTNTSATCAKSGCKAIKGSLIPFDLENPISSS